MENFVTILDKASERVRQIFKESVPSEYTFHNLEHTLTVVKSVQEISSAISLEEEDRLALLLAAWFHDTGYSKAYKGHEQESVLIADQFARAEGLSQELISKMEGCILATRMPQTPGNLLEEILCDADMAHLGAASFEQDSKRLRKELNKVFKKDIGKKEWRISNIQFLRQHHYFTPFAIQKYGPVKQQHLNALQVNDWMEKGGVEKVITETMNGVLPIGSNEGDKIPVTDLTNSSAENENRKSKSRDNGKADATRTERGIATMFRIMSENHVSLSQMADSKANIMISVNTIVLSILVSVLVGKLPYYPQFIIPTSILAVVCLTAVIFAIRATRPNVTKGVFTPEDIGEKKVNLLFFGNFYNMELREYEWAMKEMMKDRDYLYDSMIKDIYYLGKVLAKKYQLLRISYNVFMFGLVLAILSFGIASFFGMN